MESIKRNLKVQSLKAQLALSHNVCSSLAHELETEPLTDEQRSEITRRRDESLNESHILQLAIDLLERQEEQERDSVGSPIPRA